MRLWKPAHNALGSKTSFFWVRSGASEDEMTPKKPSRYDELHERYDKILSTKAGTRYERLAAMVFKAIGSDDAVIHDMKLAGTGDGVKHQIDVTIDQAGTKRRILLECKDFDISRDKINLDIARSFRSVIEDTGADEGWMVTCVGFTKDAAAFAKSKGIKLLVLRVFEEKDMEGRIREIHARVHLVFPANADVAIVWDEDSDREFKRQFAMISNRDMIGDADPVFILTPDGPVQYVQYVDDAMNAAIDLNAEVDRIDGTKKKIGLPSNGQTIQVAGGAPIPYKGIIAKFEVGVETEKFEVASKRVAELLLKGFGDSDQIIFGDQLERFTIDAETGEAREQ